MSFFTGVLLIVVFFFYVWLFLDGPRKKINQLLEEKNHQLKRIADALEKEKEDKNV